MMTVEEDGVVTKMSRTFWRGENTHFRPRAAGLQKPTALYDHFLRGFMPAEPFIDKDTTVVAFGSCFAQHVSSYLNTLGFNVASREGKAYVTSMGDGIVNTYAIRQQFEWAWEARVPQVSLWHGYKAEEFGYDEDVRVATQELFDRADVFIITLGLSEIWYDEPTGEVFWRAVPAEQFDPSRHKFRVASQAENKANILAIHRLIRKHRPRASIVFTLSPIPLAATFRPIGSFPADAVSKASLRSAIDEVIQELSGDKALYYYPAFEVVREAFSHPYQPDLRHPYLHVLNLNMRAFERYFCRTGLEDAELGDVYLNALALDRQLGEIDEAEGKRLADDLKVWRTVNRAPSIAAETIVARRAAEKAARVAEREARIAAREQRLRAREARLASRKPGSPV
jgi:hypothetical protein